MDLSYQPEEELQDIKTRIKNGEIVTANHYKSDGVTGLNVGDPFHFNYEDYVVTEICDGDMDGLVWIKRAI